jgi:hypothetical protein
LAAWTARVDRLTMPDQNLTTAESETVAIRHHLDTLILKLAAAQAGSLDAVRDSRMHAEAALAILNGSEEVMCEHARFSGVGQTDEAWMCEGCGASWPKSASVKPPPPLRTHRRVHDPAPIATVPDPDALGEPINSL